MTNCNDPGGMPAGRYRRSILEVARLKWLQAWNRRLPDGEEAWRHDLGKLEGATA